MPARPLQQILRPPELILPDLAPGTHVRLADVDRGTLVAGRVDPGEEQYQHVRRREAVADQDIIAAQLELARAAGVYAAPEAAATWAAMHELRRTGFLDGTERVVLFCTGMGLKYPAPRTDAA